MAKQIKARRVATKRVNETRARELWLASLGAVAMTQKQGAKLYATMVAEGRNLQSRVQKAVDEANAQINARIAQVNKQIAGIKAEVEGRVQPLRQRAEATYLVIADEITVRLQPLLTRFGVKAPAKRKPAAKTRKVVRRPAKKAAKRAPRKAA